MLIDKSSTILNNLSPKAATYLQKLCVEIPNRRVGSQGNQTATDFFAEVVESFGFEVEKPAFACMDWNSTGVSLSADRLDFQAFASPYSLGCHVHAPFAVVSTVEELEAAQVSDQILVLHGELARQQLMPKNFPFYNPDEHKQIIHLLETRKPLAIIAMTSRDPEMVGSMYPFPLIEDGDFNIPSIYMTDVEGQRLLEQAGAYLTLESQTERIPAKGCNVIARKGNSDRRVVLFAHIDAKIGTPGALDNASGVVVLLLLAELLTDYSGHMGIEMVALNGEDYYCSPGEQQYLTAHSGAFDQIVLGVNIDGVGYHRGDIAYSLYECPAVIAGLIDEVLPAHRGLIKGKPWYQGDHGLFTMNHTPALAFTSERVMELMTQIVHTAEDTPEILEPSKLANLAVGLHDLLVRLDR